jgi:hypothetical protein
MGFIDSIKEALGGDHDDEAAAPPPAPPAPVQARHVDLDAPKESEYSPQVTGGKHRA